MAIEDEPNRYRKPTRSRPGEEDRRAQAELMWTDRLTMTQEQIARKYGVSVRTVLNRFKEFPKENFQGPIIKKEVGIDINSLSLAAKIWEDRTNGMTYQQIADKHDVCLNTVKKHLKGFFPDRQMIEIQKMRLREDDKLDFLEEKALELLGTDHYVVSHGKVILDPSTMTPMIDSAPKFQAIKTLLDIHARRGKLHGSDAPQKAEVTHNVGEREEEELGDLLEEARRKQEATEARIRAALKAGGEENIIDAEVVEES